MLMPSLAVELPHDWAVAESAIVRSSSGTEIRVWLDNQPETTDLHAIAERLQSTARDEVGDIDDVVASEIQLGGHVAHARRFTFDRGGDTMVGRVVCFVESGRALIATAAWRHESDATAASEMDTVIAGMRLVDIPVGGDESAGEANSAKVAVNTTGLDIAMWSPIIGSWASATSTEPDSRHAGCWSSAELAVAAAFRGATEFPTVGVEGLVGLQPSSVDAIIDTVARSLIARGLLVRTDDGKAELEDDLRYLLDAALLAELVIDVARLSDAGVQRTWLGASVDRAVRIAVTDNGSRRIDLLDPADLAAAALVAAGDTGPSAGHNLEQPHGPITTAMVGDPSSEWTSLTRITTTWRLDGRLHGGMFSWAQHATGAGWLAEPAGDEWTLHRADGLRSTLLAHLPAGAI